MSNVLFFIAGFITALVFIGVLIIFGAIWWFVKYTKHVQDRNQKVTEVQKVLKQYKSGVKVSTDFFGG